MSGNTANKENVPGVQKYYHENGKVMIEGEWNEGKESGPIKEYDETGKLVAEKTFNNGQLDEASG